MIWTLIWILGGAFFWIGSTKGWLWGVAAVIVASLIKMALAWGLVFLGDFGASWIKHEGKFFSFLKWIPAPLAAYITWFIFGAPEL
jgi:hypothetical protein